MARREESEGLAGPALDLWGGELLQHCTLPQLAEKALSSVVGHNFSATLAVEEPPSTSFRKASYLRVMSAVTLLTWGVRVELCQQCVEQRGK